MKCGRTVQVEGIVYAKEPGCYWVEPEVLNLECMDPRWAGFRWPMSLLKLNEKCCVYIPMCIIFLSGRWLMTFIKYIKGLCFSQKVKNQCFW